GLSEAFKDAVERAHRQREEDYVERPSTDLVRETLADFGYDDVEPEVIRSAVESMYRVSQRHWKPIEGARDTVEFLVNRGYRVGMISNASDVDDVHYLVDKVDVRDYLDPIVVSAGVGMRKPAPEIFKPVLEAWDLPAGAVVMVGDTLNADILGAQRIGMHQIWVRSAEDREDNRSWREKIEPEAAVGHVSEIPVKIADLSRKTQGV
ncbi:MAG: HAD family hydrolase, partial [Anaerolineales bacterium]|nr:HAD family hydrolase [Anaerolineales bacterium]